MKRPAFSGIRKAWFAGRGPLHLCILDNPTPDYDELQLMCRSRPHLRKVSPEEAGKLFLQERCAIAKADGTHVGQSTTKTPTKKQIKRWKFLSDRSRGLDEKLRSFPSPADDGKGSVYLLHSAKHEAFKIGKASGTDPTHRLYQIRANSTADDAEIVCFIQLVSERNALKLEHSLHQRFAPDAYDGVEGDGSTEWFKNADLPNHFAAMIKRKEQPSK